MKIGIIGAGFTGLGAANALTKKGHNVTIFERDSLPGGLAIGFKKKEWHWTLEKHYHHWFTSDKYALSLANEIGYEVVIKRPKTSVYVDSTFYQLDSPKSVLLFPKLTPAERLRMASVLGILRYNPIWKPLESVYAAAFLEKWMGKNAYKMLWEPQLINKFGPYASEMSLAWFWARISKRTASLAYPKEGFLPFAQAVVEYLRKKGATILFNAEVTNIESSTDTTVEVSTPGKTKQYHFDKVIVTLPSFFFLRITPQLPTTYRKNLDMLKGLGAVNLVLRLKNQFLTDNTYWLSICQKGAPVMAIVEHTNFMDRKYYNNEHLLYLGNYLQIDHPYYNLTKEKLLETYDPFLKKINPGYKKGLIGYDKFAVPFAQPIVPVNYSKMIPPFKTPLKNIYLANIQQVYPWDRGTNYALAIGESVANLIDGDK